jgi:phospholipid-binding lipoprotein MlaA
MRSALTAMSLAAAFAATPGMAGAQEVIADPWEQTNRDLFAVHESVDRAVLEPVARGYRAVTPRPLRRGVVNFLRNLSAPVTFANDVLQGEGARAGVTAARFGINTLAGFGLFDPASSLGLEFHEEDFGQTLAVWGVDAGPYVFVPLMGPTSVRDGAGRLVDIAFDPLNWADFEGEDAARATRAVVAGLAAREAVIEAVDDVRVNSLDPYVSIRSSYALLRQSAVQNGDVASDASEAIDAPLEATPPAAAPPSKE